PRRRFDSECSRSGSPEMRLLALNQAFAHLQRSGRPSANAREVGSKQLDMFKSHAHQTFFTDAGAGSIAVLGYTGNRSGTINFTSAAGGSEARPVNTALHPLITL